MRWLWGAAIGVFAGTARAQVVAGVDLSTIPVQVYDRLQGAYVAPITTNLPVRGLAADDPHRIFYISTGPQLYRMSYDPPRTVTPVASYSGAVAGISGGLAWDSARQRLYGTTTSSLYEIDPNTAVVTLVRAIGAGDFGGLDYDPVTDRLYGANDSTAMSGGLSGRGIYTFTPPYATGALTRVAPYPQRSAGVEETDADGLAVGDGRVFLVCDETQWMYTWNISTQQYEPNVAQNAFGSDRGFSGATWAPGLLRADPFDVRVTLNAPGNCTVQPGGTAAFSTVVANPGSAGVTNVVATFTLPPNAAFVGSNPAGMLNGSTLTISLGSMSPATQRPIDVSIRPLGPGTFALQVNVSLAQSDPAPINNSAGASTAVGTLLPTQASIRGVLSTIPSSPTSLIPGLGGARFASDTAPLGRPFASPDGAKWILWSDSDIADTLTDGVLVVWNGSSLSVVAREGVFPLLPSVGGPYPPLVINPVQGINDAGSWTFSGLDARQSTEADGFVAKVVNGVVTVVAQEDTTPAPGIGPNIFFGALRGSANIANDNRVSFATSLSGSGVSAVTDAALVAQDGGLLLARKGISVPGNQQDGFGNPTAFTDRSFDWGGVATGFSMDALGQRYAAAGAINASMTLPPTSGVDRVSLTGLAGQSGSVVIQENVAYPGLPATPLDAAPISYVHTDPPSRTFVIGSCNNGADFVLMDGAAAALTGQPITPGDPERWSDARWAPCFFLACSNAAGQSALGGYTTSADPLLDSAVVSAGRVIARENDPVDLDSNGVFDDGVFIAGFLEYRAFLAGDALYAVVRLRNAASASGCAPDADAGQALVRIPLGAPCPPCVADFNQSGGTPDDADISAFFAAWNSGDACADANRSGGTPDDADISVFFTLWNSGGC